MPDMKKVALLALSWLWLAGNCHAATRTVSAAGGPWDSTSTWVGATVPVAGDDVVFNSASGNVVIDVVTANLNSLDMTGYTGTLSYTYVNNVCCTQTQIRIYPSGTQSVKIAGNISWPGWVNFIIDAPAAGAINYYSTTNAYDVEFNCSGGTGIINIQTDITLAVSRFFAGTFNTNNHNIAGGAYFWDGGTTARTINLGTSTITSTGNYYAWYAHNSYITMNASQATIITNYSAANFYGNGFTYGTVKMLGGGTVYDASNFANLTIGSGVTVNFQHGATQTITTSFSANGATLQSDSAGSAFTLSKSLGTVTVYNAKIKDSAAGGGASWKAVNSTNVSGNSGWVFSVVPIDALWLSGD